MIRRCIHQKSPLGDLGGRFLISAVSNRIVRNGIMSFTPQNCEWLCRGHFKPAVSQIMLCLYHMFTAVEYKIYPQLRVWIPVKHKIYPQLSHCPSFPTRGLWFSVCNAVISIIKYRSDRNNVQRS